jgi:hypothetical protein
VRSECRLTVLGDEVIPPGSGRGAYFPALVGGEETPELHGSVSWTDATWGLRGLAHWPSTCHESKISAHDLASPRLALTGDGVVRLGVVLLVSEGSWYTYEYASYAFKTGCGGRLLDDKNHTASREAIRSELGHLQKPTQESRAPQFTHQFQ